MSVPGLSPAGLDLATLLRLSSHGPIAAASTLAVAQAASGATGGQAQALALAAADLSLLTPGEAPSDDSIGLYSAALGDPTLAERAARDGETILRDFGRAPIDPRAVDDLRSQLATAPKDLAALAQALASGDTDKARALAADIGAVPGRMEPAALPEPLRALILAAAQPGDAAAIQAQTQALRESILAEADALPPALAQLLAAAMLPAAEMQVDPMLMAMQWSLMLGAKSTLERLRKLRRDRLELLPVEAVFEFEEEEARRRAAEA